MKCQMFIKMFNGNNANHARCNQRFRNRMNTMTYLNEFDCHYGVIMELYRVSVSMSIFYAT